MTRETAFRRVVLGPARVEVRRDAGGGYRLRSPAPLGAYPAKLTERLLRWAREFPERTFVAKRVKGGDWRRIGYREALDAARRLGQGLLERGLSADRPLMILSENDLEHAVLALAALHVGVPFVPLSPAYSLVSQDYGKLRHAVQLMTPGLVFAADRRYDKAIAAAVPKDTEVSIGIEGLLREPTATVDAAHAAIKPASISKFLLTSGSTGLPKAVIHTQQMLASNQQMIVDCMPFLAEEPPVLVDWLPWNHTFGGSHNYGLALYNGGTLYIDEGRPVPRLIDETLRNLREIAPTVYFNVPRGFEEIARALEADAALARTFFSRVRMLFYAAASLSQPIWDALHRLAEKTVGERILMITGLGMTETAPFAICANWEAGRSGGIGHPAPGTEVRLAPVAGKLEVRYKGPNVTPGYWRQEELTRASFDDEDFFRSGDAARFIDAADAQKGLAFDGRIAEDFKLDSGTWVSVGPLRAQVIAAGDPWVQDAVIAGHDRREVCALVVPRPGTQAPDLQGLLDALAARSTGGSTRIARAILLAGPLSIDAGEITDKGSINQRAVLECRADLVELLYTEPYAPHVLSART
ncbi:MAG: feruloyl-CoA synthase [Betaproteobacteria bacterium]|nr:feruloyl-CoA synthase [Betaproteobacteria bacterium]MDH4326005.1 feruloyl-CoA synthase [Betaproteobacteria bacterium]MDH5579324.1 feruloyl-CoA synthase [Betaproteobacteria bacterium]